MLLQLSSEGTALKKGFPYLVLAIPLFLGQFGFGLTGFSSLKPTGLGGGGLGSVLFYGLIIRGMHVWVR